MRPVAYAAVCALSLGALAGCSLIPDYHRPQLPVAAGYPTGDAYKGANQSPEQAVRSADDIGWRDFFADPRLQSLIDIALRNNRDLRVAALNVAAAQAQYRIERSDLFPQISASGTGELGSLPASATVPIGATGIGSLGSGSTPGPAAPASTVISTGNQHVPFHFYNVGVGFTSYELDLFGRLRSLTTQAFEQYLGEADTARSTQISLVAEVASGYLTVTGRPGAAEGHPGHADERDGQLRPDQRDVQARHDDAAESAAGRDSGRYRSSQSGAVHAPVRAG